MQLVHKMRPTATDVTRSAVCVSVLYYVKTITAIIIYLFIFNTLWGMGVNRGDLCGLKGSCIRWGSRDRTNPFASARGDKSPMGAFC